jgi:hypothetical protein
MPPQVSHIRLLHETHANRSLLHDVTGFPLALSASDLNHSEKQAFYHPTALLGFTGKHRLVTDGLGSPMMVDDRGPCHGAGVLLLHGLVYGLSGE